MNNEKYIIDLDWLDDFPYCRQPDYETINYKEFFFLNEDGEVADVIQLYNLIDYRFAKVNKYQYKIIKKYFYMYNYEVKNGVLQKKEIKKYRKRPAIVEAFQIGCQVTLPDWFCNEVTANNITTYQSVNSSGVDSADIITPEGLIHAEPGDFIVRDENGSVSAYKQAIFNSIYEEVQ